jgi:hypothetical protein
MENKTYDAIVAEARQLDELEECIEQEQDDFDPNGPFDETPPALSFDWDLDEDDEVTGGFFYSDIGDYASAVSELD